MHRSPRHRVMGAEALGEAAGHEAAGLRFRLLGAAWSRGLPGLLLRNCKLSHHNMDVDQMIWTYGK